VGTCSHCGGDLPDNATFCPSCGRRTDLPAPEPSKEPIDVQQTEPRYFGLGSPVFLFGVLLVLLVAGIVLLAFGALVIGVILVVLAACLLPAFLAGARRWPDTRLARAGVNTADRVRDEADVAAESISTWSKAGRDVVRLRKEQFRLRRERDEKIRELGVSVYQEDGRADELKAAARELDDRRTRNEHELQRTIAGARRRTRKRRATVVSTEILPPTPEEDEEPEPEAEATEKA
jgi:hypothetical protein